jgi:hypothetical protein
VRAGLRADVVRVAVVDGEAVGSAGGGGLPVGTVLSVAAWRGSARAG